MNRAIFGVSTLVLVMALVPGCGPPAPPTSAPTPTLLAGEDVPFVTISRGGVRCVPMDTEVRSFFITDPEQVDEAFHSIFSEEIQTPGVIDAYEDAQRTDFGTHALLSIQRQCEGTTGYDVVVQHVVLHGEESMSVYTELWDPWGAANVEASYQHIIRIPWTGTVEPSIDIIGYHLSGKPTPLPAPQPTSPLGTEDSGETTQSGS